MNRSPIELSALFVALALLASCGGTRDGADGSKAGAAAIAPARMALPATPGTGAVNYAPLLQQLYVAYFARPADPAGLAWFAARFAAVAAPSSLAGLGAAYDADGAVRALVDTFAGSAETQALYGGDNAAFIAALYHNLFSREPEAAGLAYWTALLDSKQATRASATVAVLLGARGTDSEMVASKLRLAAAFTGALDTPARVRAYDGVAPNATASALLAQARPGMAADAELALARSAIATLVAAAQTPPDAGAGSQATLAQIEALVGAAQCVAASDCQSLALGAKPCGGPDSYLPWSAGQTSADALGALAYRYRQQRLALQAASGATSDCRFVPDPGATCTARPDGSGQRSCTAPGAS